LTKDEVRTFYLTIKDLMCESPYACAMIF